MDSDFLCQIEIGISKLSECRCLRSSKFYDPKNAFRYNGGVSPNWRHGKGTMKTGYITCSICGSRVGTSSKVYGGLMRVVCLNEKCEMSEANYYKENE